MSDLKTDAVWGIVTELENDITDLATIIKALEEALDIDMDEHGRLKREIPYYVMVALKNSLALTHASLEERWDKLFELAKVEKKKEELGQLMREELADRARGQS